MSEADESSGTCTTVLTRPHEFSRLPLGVDDTILRTTCGAQAAAKVRRESVVGVSLALEHTIEVAKDDRVCVVCGNAVFPAIVRRFDLKGDGTIIVTLDWADPQAE
ncbi:MAG: hypothetical protein WD875_04585 [Pirellulales bacterium]